MKTVNIRFLKQGLIELSVPTDASIEDIIELGKAKLDTMSDRDLVMAMSDYTPSDLNPSIFDSASFQVEAIELPDSEYEYAYMTDLWKEYAGITND